MDGITIFNEDCIETMKRLSEENRKVDIILTSPPYNSSLYGCKSMKKENITDDQKLKD